MKQNKLLTKIIFSIKKPTIIICDDKDPIINNLISQILGKRFKVGKYSKANIRNTLENNILILPADMKGVAFFAKNAKKTILAILELETIGQALKQIKILKKKKNNLLILNIEEEKAKSVQEKIKTKTLTISVRKTADLKISDLNQGDDAINFKIHFQGNIVPIWMKGKWKKNEILYILTAIACALELGLNLIEISQSLKNFEARP